VITDGETIIGGTALASVSKYRIRGYHALPFTPYYGVALSGSILANTDLTQQALTVLIENLPRSAVYDFVLPPGEHSLHAWIWKGFDISVYVTHEVPSHIQVSEYRNTLSAGKKRDLQTVQKLVTAGALRLEKGEHIRNDVLQLVRESSKRIGYSNPEKVFGHIGKLADATCIGIYHPEHGLLAGNMLFEDDRTVYNLFNASQRIKDPKLSLVNTLSTFESVQHALGKGKSFDFEGSMLKGVEKFYRSMGGTVKPVYRVIRSGSTLYNLTRFMKLRINGRQS
jgi:hypothetical protein